MNFNGATKMFYADSGINWIFVYEVEYEDEDIIVLKDLGRFHKFDEDRSFNGKISKWVEVWTDGWCRVDGKLKLCEVK